MATEMEIGKVTDYFARAGVAGIELMDTLKAGEKIHIKGHTTDMETVAESIQINNSSVTEARPGDSVGVKVPDRVRRGDMVFKVLA